MCGRFTLAAPAEELVEAFDIGALTFEYFSRYNVAPGQEVVVVAEDRAGRRAGTLSWGFVPSWSDGSTRPMINARSESVSEKPMFRDAFERRRCLVPADGFYEWSRPEGGSAKHPYWLHPTAPGVLSFGAIWETSQPKGQPARHTLAILTTAANADLSGIHDRMPLLVPSGERDRWLDRTVPGAGVLDLLRPAPAGTLSRRLVSNRVNRVGVDDPGLIEPAGS